MFANTDSNTSFIYTRFTQTKFVINKQCVLKAETLLHISATVSCDGVNVHPKTGYKNPEGNQSYNSTLSLTSKSDGGGQSNPCPDLFTSEKETWYPFYRRLDGHQRRSGRLQKLAPTWIRSQDRLARSGSLYGLRYPRPHFSGHIST